MTKAEEKKLAKVMSKLGIKAFVPRAGFLVVLPSGKVRRFTEQAAAERYVKRLCKSHMT